MGQKYKKYHRGPSGGIFLFEGVWVANYRNPGPRREEPRVGSGPNDAFPVDPLQNSVRLIFTVKKKVFGQFLVNWGPIVGSNR